MPDSLFRKVAIERQSSPERLDLLMQVTSPKRWLALLALGGLSLASLAWSFLGSIPVEVSGQGILRQGGGTQDLLSSAAGVLAELYIQPGQAISKGDAVALLARGATSITATSPYDGRVLGLIAGIGEAVAEGEPLARIESVGAESGRVEALLYFSAGSAGKLREGMPAEISPLAVDRSEYGFLRGRVDHVSEYPSSSQGMLRSLQNEGLVQALSREGSSIEVTVQLVPDPVSPSGYAWSSSKGPEMRLRTGVTIAASVTIERRRPISLLIPFLKKKALGGG